ncbi:SLC13 family permease [Dickeya chrysanthemi]|uniref:SLC13 family permease n=1 Tax=Dickeya chrysanthemi TaxID=556 RepID=UPI000532E98B|nr:SLC13 family permease [Dickeya chrysanthemi]
MSRYLSIRTFFVLLAILCALWLILLPPAGMPLMASRCAGVVLLTLILWSTGVLPPFLTSLIFFFLALILNIARPELIFSGFGSAAVWLIIGGFVIGSAITLSGLEKRLAEVLAPFLATSYPRMIMGLTVAAMLLGFIMPSSTGRAVVLVPVGMVLADRVGFASGSTGRVGIAVTLAMACNMPSFAILPANIPNMILSGASETLHGISFGYMRYLALHFPVLGIVKSAVMIGLVLVLFPARIQTAGSDMATPRNFQTTEKPSAGVQGKAAVILLTTLLLWMTDGIHGINPAWIGIATSVLLLLPGIGIVPPKSFNGSVDFGIVLFVAAALGLGAIVNESGLGKLVGQELLQALPLAPGQPALNFASLSAMSMLTGIVATIPGVPTVLTPMAPELAAASGMSLSAVLMTQVIGFSTVLFPYQVGPLIVAMQLSGERLGYLLKITLPLALVTFVVLLPVDFLWWRLLGWI